MIKTYWYKFLCWLGFHKKLYIKIKQLGLLTVSEWVCTRCNHHRDEDVTWIEEKGERL